MVHYTPSQNELEKNMEVISGMQEMAAHAVDTILVDPQTCWQPSDFLPDMSQDSAWEQVAALQQRAAALWLQLKSGAAPYAPRRHWAGRAAHAAVWNDQLRDWLMYFCAVSSTKRRFYAYSLGSKEAHHG